MIEFRPVLLRARHCIGVAFFALLSLCAADAAAANNSVFVSQNVPTTMALGQTYQVSVTMQNAGDTTWTPGNLYRLGTQSPQDNSTWGVARIELPAPVAPGESVTFSFSVTAPSSVGTYNFQWRMVQDAVEWFGAYTDNVSVKDGVNDALFVTENVPSTMTPGQSYPVSVTMQNTGNTTWTVANQYRLGSQNARDNTTWGLHRVELTNAVLPGDSVTFNFTVTAPTTIGTYNFQWQMVEDLVEWFGAASTNVVVKDGVNNAAFVSQSAPAMMVPGQMYPVSVTMQNTGTTTWTAASQYRLGSQNVRDNTTWGLHRVELTNAVLPGETVTFNFNVTAPTRVGAYNFQWEMVQDNVEWFGDMSTNIAVTDGVNSSVFVSQSAPSVVVPGQTYPMTVAMTNSGNTTWTRANLYRLGSQSARDNAVWGLHRVELPNDVAPGESVTFSFNITAPSVSGTYNLQWQMVEELVEWFGAQTANIAVKDGTNDSTFVGKSVSSHMTAGQTYPVTVTVTNSGNTTWTPSAQYRLGSQSPQDNSTWGLSRVELTDAVPPGQSVTFAFSVTAPSTVGPQQFQWRMVEETIEWFGAYSDPATVVVDPPSPNNGNFVVALDGIQEGQRFFEGTGVDLGASASGDVGGMTTLEIYIDGALAASVSGQSQILLGWSPLTVGVHTATVKAKDGAGETAELSRTISVVVDPQDVPIRSVLQGFKAALASGNKATALSYMSPDARSAYGSAIDALMPYWPEIVASWSDPRRISISDSDAEYAISRPIDGVTKIYLIGFVLDNNGNWLIDWM